jgi:hypothetical protein
VILINKNSTNTSPPLTLSERTSITNATYLFEVTSNASNEVVYFIAADTSNNPERYNEFQFIESSTPDLLNGTFTLELTGFYTWKVYEQASTTNLDPTGLTEIDRGILEVKDTVTPDVIYTGTQTETIVYNG